MHEKRVKERQKRIHVVERWPATTFVKEETLLLGRDEIAEHAEIQARSVSFSASNHVQLLRLAQFSEHARQRYQCRPDCAWRNLWMIPFSALKNDLAVGYFCKHKSLS